MKMNLIFEVDAHHHNSFFDAEIPTDDHDYDADLFLFLNLRRL